MHVVGTIDFESILKGFGKVFDSQKLLNFHIFFACLSNKTDMKLISENYRKKARCLDPGPPWPGGRPIGGKPP